MAEKNIPFQFDWMEEFNPTDYIGEYVYPNGQQVKKMKVQGQMMMFRQMFPKGKLRHEVSEKNGVFTATAYVYDDFSRLDNEYLACGTTSRTFREDIKISPLEWAITAAYGIALRNAGFGLNYVVSDADALGDMPEFGSAPDLEDLLGGSAKEPKSTTDPTPTTTVPTKPVEPKLTAKPDAKPQKKAEPVKEIAVPTEVSDEEYLEALKMVWHGNRMKGYTLAQIWEEDPKFVGWIAKTCIDEIGDAARKIVGFNQTKQT